LSLTWFVYMRTGICLLLTIDNLIAPVILVDVVRDSVNRVCLKNIVSVTDKLGGGVGVVVEAVSGQRIQKENFHADDEKRTHCFSKADVDVQPSANEGNLQSPDGYVALDICDISCPSGGEEFEDDGMGHAHKIVASYASTVEEAIKDATVMAATVRRLQDAMKMAPFEPDIFNR
jgi:hypothetical protein